MGQQHIKETEVHGCLASWCAATIKARPHCSFLVAAAAEPSHPGLVLRRRWARSSGLVSLAEVTLLPSAHISVAGEEEPPQAGGRVECGAHPHPG